MRVINPFFLLALISASAAATPGDSYLFQMKTSTQERAERQPSFWEVLSGRAKLNADLTVKVTDAATGEALGGVAVMVGTRIGEPFAENLVRTDDQGLAAFTHESLRGGMKFPITAGKSGYTLLSLFESPGNVVELALQKLPTERGFGFMQGKLTGFPTGFDGGTLELGLFLPATRPEGLLNFDLNLFISSYKTKIDIYGEREVPGNIVLPPQQKRYGFIPVSLSKPEFIMPLPKGLESHMAGITGTVPISPAVDAIRAKDYVSVLNMTSFNRVGYTRRMTVRGDEKFDVNARYSISAGTLTSKVSGVPSKLDVISISLLDPEGDAADFVPMDIKAMKSEELRNGAGTFKLGSTRQRLQGAGYYIFTGIFDRTQFGGGQALGIDSEFKPGPAPAATDYRWIVGSVKPVGSTRRAVGPETRFTAFLKQMKAGGVSGGNREYKFTSAATDKLTPDYTMVNVVSEKQNSVTQGKMKTVLWSTIVPGPITQLSLPDLGRPVLPNPDNGKGERFYWEVVAIKVRQPASGRGSLDLQSALRNVEHVSSFTKAY